LAQIDIKVIRLIVSNSQLGHGDLWLKKCIGSFQTASDETLNVFVLEERPSPISPYSEMPFG